MRKKCFVIMPFSKTVGEHDEEYWTIYFNMIKRIMEDEGYSCTRSEVGPYKLFSNIVKNIEDSDVVIAVLTDLNANVWYELGVRHTLKKGTIMLMQEGQKVPFDVNDFGINFYKDSIGLEQSIKKSIKEYLEKLDDGNCDSPVIDALKLNYKVYGELESKLGNMEQLIWRLVAEISKDKNITEKDKCLKRNRVLWVDDFPANNESVVNLFADKGVQFDIAVTTKQGVELFRKKEYDLIITDMGRGDERRAGLLLLKELKLLHCQTPVVVYASKRAILKYSDEALRLGAYKVTTGIVNIISVISDILESN